MRRYNLPRMDRECKPVTTAPRWHELTPASRAALEYVASKRFGATAKQVCDEGHMTSVKWALKNGLVSGMGHGYTITESGKLSLLGEWPYMQQQREAMRCPFADRCQIAKIGCVK